MTIEQQIANMAMELLAMRRELDELKSNDTKVSGNGKGRRGTKTLDTKTGKVYKSHAAAGMAVAPELGLKVHNFVWYEVITKFPDRFKDITDEEYAERVAEAETKTEPEKEPVKAQK